MKGCYLMDWKNLYAPECYGHYLNVAEGIFKSRVVQRPWLPNPESILYVMQTGIDMGISPMIALDKIRRFDKKTGPGGWMLEINLAKSLVAQKGGRFEILEQDDDHIKTKMVRPDWEEHGTHVETITLAELQRAGTAGRDNFKYFPKQMFRAAAFRQCCAVLFSDILHGATPADFAHEDLENVDGADTGDISTATVTAEDHKPKKPRSRQGKTAPSAKAQRQELEKLVCAQQLVDGALVAETDLALMKDAGYMYLPDSKQWVYEPKREHLNLQQAPAKEDEPPGQEPEPVASSDTNWDLGETSESTPDFDFKNPDHVKLLTEAASGFKWDPNLDKTVKTNFLNFIKGKSYKASIESLNGALESCASQYRN